MFRQRIPKNEKWEDIRRREAIQDVVFLIFAVPVVYIGLVFTMCL